MNKKWRLLGAGYLGKNDMQASSTRVLPDQKSKQSWGANLSLYKHQLRAKCLDFVNEQLIILLYVLWKYTKPIMELSHAGRYLISPRLSLCVYYFLHKQHKLAWHPLQTAWKTCNCTLTCAAHCIMPQCNIDLLVWIKKSKHFRTSCECSLP